MHGRLQLEMRENPASDRRHGSRPAVGSTANGSYREHENLTSREREPWHNLAAAPISGSSQTAPPQATTGEERSNDTWPADRSRSCGVAARSGFLGLWKDAQALHHAIARHPLGKILALSGARNP